MGTSVMGVAKMPPRRLVSKRPAKLGPKRPKRERVKEESFKLYIFRLLKLVRPNNTISSKAMSIMNSLVNDMFNQIVEEASKITKRNAKATLGWREVNTAVRLLLPGELAIHACAEAVRAKGKYEIFTDMDKNIRQGTFATPTMPLFSGTFAQ